jgi:hypothetical protein
MQIQRSECTTLPSLTRSRCLAAFATFVIALALDRYLDLPGQLLLGAGVWAVLFYVMAGLPARERWALWPCLVIATVGEIFLSLVWGLYTYRLDNIPFFVPPGHVLLLTVAVGVAPHMPRLLADFILASAVMYAAVAAALGIDTLGLVLLAFLVAVVLNSPGCRRFYASTFVVALALELYGTALGTWTWPREVPILPFVTTNPPGLVGTFYAVLDTLVVAAAIPLARRVCAPHITVRPITIAVPHATESEEVPAAVQGASRVSVRLDSSAARGACRVP